MQAKQKNALLNSKLSINWKSSGELTIRNHLNFYFPLNYSIIFLSRSRSIQRLSLVCFHLKLLKFRVQSSRKIIYQRKAMMIFVHHFSYLSCCGDVWLKFVFSFPSWMLMALIIMMMLISENNTSSHSFWFNLVHSIEYDVCMWCEWTMLQKVHHTPNIIIHFKKREKFKCGMA